MPPRTCPHCGAKNFTPNPKCSACGKPLAAAKPPTSVPISLATKSPPPPIPIAPTVKPPSSPVPVAAARTPFSPPAPSAGYPTAAPSTSAPPCSPLPASMAGLGTPLLEGEVVDTSQIQVTLPRKRSILRGTLAFFLLLFRPFLVLAAWIFGGHKPTEYRTIYLVRVQRTDRTIGQARIEHDMVGATMDLGDYVSIWGHSRRGIVFVQRAYNHTVDAEVRLHQPLGLFTKWVVGFLIFLFVIFLLGALTAH